MRTVKLVVIGASGVGKTSIRNQYISGRFTTGYRATIGADFITKTLPHHSNPDESVTLQIWDTAGQERFSSLSSAFFRGADAVLLMFDVNQLQTLEDLRKWWDEFKERAPVPDEEADKFCIVVVGNKIDITTNGGNKRVSEEQTLRFINELIPPSPEPHTPSPQFPPRINEDENQATPTAENGEGSHARIPALHLEGVPESYDPPRTDSIDISLPQTHRRRRAASTSASRSRSRSTLFRGGTIGTVTTTHSIYHTPSSSLFDHFESAHASPVLTASSISLGGPRPESSSGSPGDSPVRRMSSISSISSSSAPTITPSLFGRDRGQAATTACTTPSISPASQSPLPPPPERRPKLFFTSAKTGEGVAEVFEYMARRVVRKWEYEEAVEARTLHMQEASVDETIRLRSLTSRTGWNLNHRPSCCAS